MQKEIEDELEAIRVIEFEKRMLKKELEQEIAQKNEALVEKDHQITELMRALEELKNKRQ
jgi:hypothetical protein